MTILDLQKKYYKKIDQRDLDLILENVLKKPRAFMLAHPEYEIPRLKINNCKLKIARRIKGEPLAYIFGHKEFYGLDFVVNKNVLVPRPETELMVNEVINFVSKKSTDFKLIDIGTGSGCIAITIAKTLNKETIAIDISAKALAVAKKNAKLHGVEKKIKFIKGDLMKPILNDKKMINNLTAQAGKCEMLILANLPYVETDWKKKLDSAETRGLRFEPSIALYSGKDGLDHYRKLARHIKMLNKITKKPITLFCEIGHKQAGGMKKIFSFAEKLEIKKDHNCYYRLAMIEI